jgi:hypothetical protein
VFGFRVDHGNPEVISSPVGLVPKQQLSLLGAQENGATDYGCGH